LGSTPRSNATRAFLQNPTVVSAKASTITLSDVLLADSHAEPLALTAVDGEVRVHSLCEVPRHANSVWSRAMPHTFRESMRN